MNPLEGVHPFQGVLFLRYHLLSLNKSSSVTVFVNVFLVNLI